MSTKAITEKIKLTRKSKKNFIKVMETKEKDVNLGKQVNIVVK